MRDEYPNNTTVKLMNRAHLVSLITNRVLSISYL